uniref:Polymerase (RNA) III (DNA directed) polypeptide G n=1 Tax=Amphilophus citrinellus TaxID=61819 RepID=A0A3Q0RBQ6_AMPCI
MAGKGRGVGAFTFNIDALGIGRGNMPEARVGPSPLFPSTDFKPVPLKAGEDEDYMLALKQEMRGTMQRLPFNIKPHNDISYHCKNKEPVFNSSSHKEEKCEDLTQGHREHSQQIRCKLHFHLLLILSLSLELANKDDPEKSDDETETKTRNENEKEEIEEEEYEEEDIEEENDYIESYFDNGEDFAADSDDNMDGEATY